MKGSNMPWSFSSAWLGSDAKRGRISTIAAMGSALPNSMGDEATKTPETSLCA